MDAGYRAIADRYNGLVRTWQALPQAQRGVELESFAVQYAYNSGKIENDRISYHDTHEVFEAGRVISYTGDVRTLFEIQNLKTSWEWALTTAQPGMLLSEALIRHAHELLTWGTYDEQRWAAGERPGAYKRGEYVVGAYDVGCRAADVPDAMRELVHEVNEQLGDAQQAITVASYLHARFAEIHPFADGNGRVARLLTNTVLLSMELPPVVVREQDRMAYYGALDAFHDGELEPFKLFLMSETTLTWERLLG